MRSGSQWEDFKAKNRRLMEHLVEVISPGGLNLTSGISSEEEAAMEDLLTKGEGKRWMTGAQLPTEWESRFDLFLDTIRARWACVCCRRRRCSGMALSSRWCDVLEVGVAETYLTYVGYCFCCFVQQSRFFS